MMRHAVEAETACRDAMIRLNEDESVLILLNHCREMKKQEMRLRLITLLLLFGCAALFIFSTCTGGLRWRENFESRVTVGKQTTAYSGQNAGCAPDGENVQREAIELRIHLRSKHDEKMPNSSYLLWDPEFGKEHYSQERRAIVIPKTGFYFIYLRFNLLCEETDDDSGDNKFQNFFAQLDNWNKGYDKVIPILQAQERFKCSAQEHRSVFVGQLFDLLQGDHVSVNIKTGYPMIRNSAYGAFLQ